MSEMREILVDTAARLFGDLCTNERYEVAEQGGFNADAWSALEDAGLTRATVSEARGGDGADIGDALAMVREAGRFALPLPLTETLLAELALAAAGLPCQPGVGTVGPVTSHGAAPLKLLKTARGWELSGTLLRVPSARHASYLAAVAQCDGKWTTVVVCGDDLARSVIRKDINWANEPRDTLVFKRLAIDAAAVGRPGKGWSPEDVRLNGAMFRVSAMSGGLSRVLQYSVQYAKERVQFGRPIGQFQAVQQQLAVLATQSAAASAAADAMTDAVTRGPAQFEVAAAKARVGEAAHIGSGIAHQVHGAMGFTYEHALHRSTRRLWAWRDEFGSEVEWAEWVGRVIAQVGGSNLWSYLTDDDKSGPIGSASRAGKAVRAVAELPAAKPSAKPGKAKAAKEAAKVPGKAKSSSKTKSSSKVKSSSRLKPAGKKKAVGQSKKSGPARKTSVKAKKAAGKGRAKARSGH